jgi:hypothetical protein
MICDAPEIENGKIVGSVSTSNKPHVVITFLNGKVQCLQVSKQLGNKPNDCTRSSKSRQKEPLKSLSNRQLLNRIASDDETCSKNMTQDSNIETPLTPSSTTPWTPSASSHKSSPSPCHHHHHNHGQTNTMVSLIIRVTIMYSSMRQMASPFLFTLKLSLDV